MTSRRSGLRKQITEAKKRHWRLRRGRGNAPGWGWEEMGVCSWDREHAGSSILRAFKDGDFRDGPSGGSQ